jgi:hypothetical protein
MRPVRLHLIAAAALAIGVAVWGISHALFGVWMP